MRWAVAALVLGACGSEPGETQGVHPLDPVQHLTRVSLAIRGTRPTVEEIDQVQRDPNALPGLVDAWMETPEFAATIRDMWAEILLLRNDTFNQLPVIGTFAQDPYTSNPALATPPDAQNPKHLADLDRLYQGTVEEPLKLIEYIVTNNLPFTDIVTADYMLTDNVMINAQVRYIDIDTTATVENNAVAPGTRAKVDVDVDPFIYMVGLGYKF